MNAQPELSFPSEPITGETRAAVELVSQDWRADEDWRRFKAACMSAAHRSIAGNHVDPNDVRAVLTNDYGLTIEPRRYSAFWARAAGKNGFLDADGWVINNDSHGRNQGKPLRRYRLRAP